MPNLRQILEGQVEVKHGNLGGFATDEYGDSTKIDNSLQYLARRLVQFANNNYTKPSSFLGIGGTKIFRDDIWGRLRFIYRADHMVYRKLGTYDFPQREYKTRIKNAFLLLLLKSPAFRGEFNKRMKKESIKPLQKVLEN